MTPIIGKLASKISILSNQTLTEIGNYDTYKVEEYKKYIEKDDVAINCVNQKCKRASDLIGNYQHSNEQIQSFIRNMLDNMTTGLDKVVGQLAGCMPYGFSVAELEFGIKNHRLILKSIDVLNRDKITFRGANGIIHEIGYSDNTKKWLPYWKVIHVTNGHSDDDNPFGIPEAKAALPFIKAKQAINMSLVVATNILSTGILYAKLNPNKVVMKDEFGNNLKRNGKDWIVDSAQAFIEQVKNIENNKFLIVGKDDEVGSLQIGDGSQLFNTALPYYDNKIRNSFGVPQIVLDNPQALSGMATVTQKQTNSLDNTISVVVEQIQDQIIKKAIKPILIENFKEYENFGSFQIDKSSDPTIELQVFANMMTAVSMQVLNAQDTDVQQRIREILGLPKRTLQDQIRELQNQARLQQIQQDILPPQISSDPSQQNIDQSQEGLDNSMYP